MSVYGEANFVIVDDQETELATLVNALWRIGMPFQAYLYDSFEGIVQPPPAPLNTIRILAVDINLSEMTSPTAENVTTLISDVIRKLIAGGPYALIFWSKHVDLAENIMELLRDKNRNPGLPQPLGFEVLNKIDFQITDGSDGQDSAASLDALKVKIKETVSKFKTLEALMGWECRVQQAAARTLSGFYDASVQSEEELKNILRSVSIEATGKTHANENPAFALEEGLSPILHDFLAHLPNDTEYNANISNLLNISGPSTRLTTAAAARLNQFYTVAIQPPPKKTSRGAWILINGDDAHLEQMFGKNREKLFEEFLSFEKITDNAERRATRREVLSKCQLGLIEISAGCDHAQNKPRLYRYVLSAVIPYEYCCYTHFKSRDLTKDRKHEGIYRLPPLCFPHKENGAHFIIKVNARFTLGLTSTSETLGEVQFRIKAPLINAVAKHHSEYHIRPGLVTFSS